MITVLVIDDDPNDVAMIRRHLDAADDLVCLYASSIEEAPSIAPDVVVCDLNLGEHKQADSIGLCRQRYPASVLIAISSGGTNINSLALAGADDFTSKGALSELAARIRWGYVMRAHDAALVPAISEELHRAVARFAESARRFAESA